MAASYDRFYAFTYDGRYLAELLRHALRGIFPPTLLLLAGLACLVLASLTVSFLFGVRDWRIVSIVSAVFSLFPLFFDVFGYFSIRFTVPLGALFAVMALLPRQPLWGAPFVMMALGLYQSAVNLTIVVAVYLTIALLLEGEKAWDIARRYVLGWMIMFGLGVAGYAAAGALFVGVTGVEPERLAGMANVAGLVEHFVPTAVLTLSGMYDLLLRGWFLFPLVAKVVFLVFLAGLFVIAIVRGSWTAAVLVVVAPFCVLSPLWMAKWPIYMLQDRILFPFAGVYLCVLLICWIHAERFRKVILAMGGALVVIFIYQVNVWHEFMYLRNKADLDMASLMAQRIAATPGYRANMKIAVIGTNRMEQYLPFRIFPDRRKLIKNSYMSSMFAQQWSAPRAIMFYLPLSDVALSDLPELERLHVGMPAWPSPGAIRVRVDENLVILRL